MRGSPADGGGGRGAATRRLNHFRRLALVAALWAPPAWGRQVQGATEGLQRMERGRFTVLYAQADARLATSLAESAVARDSFPGLPRPQVRVQVWVAPNDAYFRRWAGDGAPEWGSAFAFPVERRVVLHGHRGGARAGDPLEVLRHELAHLALHEAMGEEENRNLLIFGGFIAFLYIFTVHYIGFVITTPVFMAIYMYVTGYRNKVMLVVSPILAVAVFLLLFVVATYIPLPRGIGIFKEISLLIY